MKFYSIIKKKEITTSAEKWMELKVIMVSKISQVQWGIYCKFPLRCGL
jgi:hypothetical protein